MSPFYYRAKPKSICPKRVMLVSNMNATYGKVSMHGELQALGFDIGLHRVRKSMKRLGLVAKRPKQHKYLTGGKPLVITPNHLNRQFNP